MDTREFDKMFEVEETNWWYRGRRRLVENQIRAHHELHGPLKILDIASATGMSFRFLTAYGQTWGVDISPETIRLCGKRGVKRLVQGDALHLPFRSSSFDAILALDALEHFADDRQALREIARVARPDALILITVPAFMFLWSPHDEAFHHFRRYTAGELRRKLAETGFHIEQLSYYSMTLLPPVWAFRKLRARRRAHLDHATSDFFVKLPAPLELLLGGIMRAEIELMKLVSLPFGVSLFCRMHRRELPA
ncbi:MAG: class I SAM-dependent methyltransferase [Planctomycetota bacterium]